MGYDLCLMAIISLSSSVPAYAHHLEALVTLESLKVIRDDITR